MNIRMVTYLCIFMTLEMIMENFKGCLTLGGRNVVSKRVACRRRMFHQGTVCRADCRGHSLRNSATQRVVRRSTQDIPCRGRGGGEGGELAMSCRQRKRFWPKTASRPRRLAPGTPVIRRDRKNKGVHGHNRGSTSGRGPVRTVPTSPEHRVHLSTLHHR